MLGGAQMEFILVFLFETNSTQTDGVWDFALEGFLCSNMYNCAYNWMNNKHTPCITFFRTSTYHTRREFNALFAQKFRRCWALESSKIAGHGSFFLGCFRLFLVFTLWWFHGKGTCFDQPQSSGKFTRGVLDCQSGWVPHKLWQLIWNLQS